MAQVLAHAPNMENLRKEVQCIYSGTLDWFYLEPYQKSVQSDILVAMIRFKNVVRQKEFWCDQKQSSKNKLTEGE